MITITISNQSFILDSIQDAEQLLKIFGKAKPVDDSYDTDYKGYFYPDHSCDVRIEVTSKELVTLEEHQRRRAERSEREAAAARTKAAAQTAASEPAHG